MCNFSQNWRILEKIAKNRFLFIQNHSFLLKKRVKISFPDHVVNRKVVDNVENYLNMQFQPRVMTHSRVNGQKPIFWKIAYKKNLRVFLENRASSLFYIYSGLTSCNVSEKTNGGKYENFLSQTDGLTDRRCWIHKDSWRVLIVVNTKQKKVKYW